MMGRGWNSWILTLGLLAIGCGDDGGDSGTATVATATATASDSASVTVTDSATATDATGQTDTSDETDSASTETAGATGTTASTDPTNTGGTTATATLTTDTATSGSTGPVNMCDPVIPGEFNACHDEKGNVDNTQCNWMGLPDAQGFIGCLTSSESPGYNVCFISECEDACDCFAPPATGTAPVVCAEILDGGGTGCALACDNGETCPDGMECQSGLCFHPPA